MNEPRPQLTLTFDHGVLIRAELRSLISGYPLAKWQGIEHIPNRKQWATVVIMYPPEPLS